MNKTIIGIIALVLIAAGGWYFYSNKGGSMMTAAEPHQVTSGSLKDLMARAPSKCTVSNTTTSGESSGEVFIGNGKMRGDFTSVTKNPAMTIESHMISDGEFVYTWSDAMPQGVKIAVAAAETPQPSGQPNMYAEQVDYDCDSWNVDGSKFELPKSITFMDISSMMQGAEEPTGAGNAGSMNAPSKSAQCNMCDQAPEPQRSQCRTALQCR